MTLSFSEFCDWIEETKPQKRVLAGGVNSEPCAHGTELLSLPTSFAAAPLGCCPCTFKPLQLLNSRSPALSRRGR